jgi:branched-subunit amino acid ABC-type transport system permease component
MYYNNISPAMSFQATLKGVVATVVGGVGNVPGAIVGSMLLGLTRATAWRCSARLTATCSPSRCCW